jgi:hypothetical protein
MLNTVSALTFDPAGYVELDVLPSVTPGETRRRVNRVATLDGGSVFNDFGYTEADRILVLSWRSASRAIDEAVDRLVQLHDRVQVSTRAGVFLAAPEAYVPGDESSLRLLVVEKLSE